MARRTKSKRKSIFVSSLIGLLVDQVFEHGVYRIWVIIDMGDRLLRESRHDLIFLGDSYCALLHSSRATTFSFVDSKMMSTIIIR